HVYSATGVQGSALKQRLLARNRLRVLIRCLPGVLWLRMAHHILLYDLLASGYGILTGKTAMLTGRLEALRELATLLQERRPIQARRSAPIVALERWLEAVPPPWVTLAEQQRLDTLLRERRTL
ncbi:MAG TPA: glycosyltransferase family 2 protein, partial [Roseiflexaceae bacterium]|nr:glycosyltransferase family 2 protein [Roseiflexaceae bacterium]